MQRKRLRLQFDFTPRFEGEIQGWAMNHIKRSLWRTAREHGQDDLMQDAWFYFDRARDFYPYIITPQHFMAIFKRCFTNHIHALANKKTGRREVSLQIDVEKDGEVSTILNISEPYIDIMSSDLFVITRPTHCRGNHLFLEKSRRKALIDKVLNYAVRNKLQGTKQRRNRIICAYLGLPMNTNMVEKIKDYITEGVI
jgi:hypothetical protein